MAFAKKNPKIPEGINTSQEHPFKDFVLLFAGVTIALIVGVILLTIFAQSLAQYIPFRYELKLTGIYEQTLTEHGSELDNESDDNKLFQGAEAAIQTLGADLGSYAELPDDMHLQFHLLNAPELPNAFATLGGHIFVTTGLLKEISSENALALVLAHEIAHIKYRHPIKSLSSGIIMQLALGMVTGNQGSSAVQNILGQTGLITLLSFSREMEYQADDEARKILTKKYGHLRHSNEFFMKIAGAGNKAGWKEVFQTHPDIDRRIARFGESPEHLDSRQAKELDARIVELLKETTESDK